MSYNPLLIMSLGVMVACTSAGASTLDTVDVMKLDLDECIRMALAHNPGLLATKEALKEAGAGVREARAPFYPSISLGTRYTRISEVPALEIPAGVFGPDPVEMTFGWADNYTAEATLEQPLFTWGRLTNAYRLAKLGLLSTEEETRRVRNDLILEVHQAFYNTLYMQELVTLAEKSQAQMERHLNQVLRRYEAGIEPRFRVTRAKVELADMKANVLSATNGLKLAMQGLKMLLGLDPAAHIVLEGEFLSDSIPSIDVKEFVLVATAQRPEVKALRVAIEMAEKGVALAKASNKPTVAFMANYDYAKPYANKNEWGTSWTATVALSLPLFDGWSTSSKVAQATSRVRQADLRLQQVQEAIDLEVRSVCLALDEAQERIEARREGLKEAEDMVSMVEEQYKNGLATSLEVLDLHLALLKAKTDHLAALKDYVTAQAELRRATGSDFTEK